VSAPPRTAPPLAPITAAGGTARRRIGFDVLRVAFVLLVVLYHSTFIGPLVYRDLLPKNLAFPHQVGASLLLVLSAYFVAATLRQRDGVAATVRWWWGRLARLLPAFAVATVAAWSVLRWLAPGGWYFPSRHDLLWNLLMAWNWNGLHHWDYVDGSYWTIPLQLMAFTVAALIRRTPLGRGTALRVLLWAALLVPLALWHHRLTHPGTLYATVSDGLGLHRWHLFVAGVAIWMLATGRLRRGHAVALLVTAELAHALQTARVDAGGGLTTDLVAVAGIGLGVAALVVAACGRDRAARLPAPVVRVVEWLAGISYGVFLVHQTVGYVVMFRLQQVGVGPTLQTAAMIATAVVLGWALTRLVERPLHRRLMRAWDVGPGRYGRVAPVPASAVRPAPTVDSAGGSSATRS
jgi:peptidoglycan/LPS O-acetylase OafA/YrhL